MTFWDQFQDSIYLNSELGKFLDKKYIVEAGKRRIKHFLISNIKAAKTFSQSIPVHLFQESLTPTFLIEISFIFVLVNE